MVYLPVNAIGLPLSFLLRPGFLLLEASVALSFLPLPLPSPFSSSPAARAVPTVGTLVARLPRQGCGHRGNSSPFPAIEDGELAACAALHRSLFLTIEDRSPRVPLMDGMNKVRFIEPCVVEKRKKYRQKTKIFCLLILTYPNPIPALEWVSLPTGDSSGGPQLRPMKVNAGGGWGVDGEKGVGGIGIGGLSHGPSVGACRGAHLSGLYAEICLIFASFDVRI
ncbi:hypothetical protein GW17_00003571 [Ensete ventricosum]|nr:hypothetical protein GW17_00003571 [Ensete ventricosum]